MKTKKMTAKEKKAKRRLRYGMKKILPNTKVSLISMENKHGLSLGLALEGKTIWFSNTRFATVKTLEKLLKKPVIYVASKS